MLSKTLFVFHNLVTLIIMEWIPYPVKLHHSRNGFNHESSEDIYVWKNDRDNWAERRVDTLKEQCPEIDRNPSLQRQHKNEQQRIYNWSIKPQHNAQRSLIPTKLRDYSEEAVMKAKFGEIRLDKSSFVGGEGGMMPVKFQEIILDKNSF